MDAADQCNSMDLRQGTLRKWMIDSADHLDKLYVVFTDACMYDNKNVLVRMHERAKLAYKVIAKSNNNHHLKLAARHGAKNVLQFLMHTNVYSQQEIDSDGTAALQLAFEHRQPGAVAVLVEGLHLTPAHAAAGGHACLLSVCAHGDPGLLRALVEGPISITNEPMTEHQLQCAITICAKEGQLEPLQYLQTTWVHIVKGDHWHWKDAFINCLAICKGGPGMKACLNEFATDLLKRCHDGTYY